LRNWNARIPTPLFFFLRFYADACDAMPVDDVFLDERVWLRFNDPSSAKAEYYRPEIAEDATESEDLAVTREQVVVLGTCVDQLRKFGF
jgi:hypothetical protein